MRLLSSIISLVITATRWHTTDAHNWMNNPRARTKGLSKQAPCPARSGNSFSFIAAKGQPFGLEYAQGHPRSYTYFVVVRAGDEEKLRLASAQTLDEYLDQAPASSKSTSPGGYLSESIFDKTAIEWSGGRGGASIPLAKDSPMYEKRLLPGDPTYFERPADWRCSRDKNFNDAQKCKDRGVEVAQFKYIPSGLQDDVRAAYHSKKHPWLLAVLKYRHNLKRAQEYDLAQMMFPDSATPGEYVIMYKWGGYYNCYDVLLVDPKASGGKVPTLVTKKVWTKTDHSKYENFKFSNSKGYFCDVVPASGNVTKCLQTCEAKSSCNAINVVPYTNPSSVVFDERNYPSTSKCLRSLASKKVQASDLVCYGFIEPDPPEVGTPNTISDDPRDAVFYSTSFKQQTVQLVEYPDDGGDGEGGGDEEVEWRFGDRCLSCEDARKQAPVFSGFAYKWQLQNECRLCDK